MTGHPEIGHKVCMNHQRYHMSCDDLRHLLARSGGVCEICGTAARRKTHLCIDHDHERGNWAVRGLLCTTCNLTIDNSKIRNRFPSRAESYLTNPWVDERHGVQAPIPEPSAEWLVRVGRKKFVRRMDRWHPLSYRIHPTTWRSITARAAPWEIQIDRLEVQIPITPWERRLDMGDPS
jgi:hypothetical protein